EERLVVPGPFDGFDKPLDRLGALSPSIMLGTLSLANGLVETAHRRQAQGRQVFCAAARVYPCAWLGQCVFLTIPIFSRALPAPVRQRFPSEVWGANHESSNRPLFYKKFLLTF